jgi:hypothetical protein
MATAATVRFSCDWVDETDEKCIMVVSYDVSSTDQAEGMARRDGWGFLTRKFRHPDSKEHRTWCPRHETLFAANLGYHERQDYVEAPSEKKRYWFSKG